MASSHPDRLSWEYEGGPQTGHEIPITSPPRDEEAPGTPAPPEATPSDGSSGERRDGLEGREVRSEDPDLSPETNQRLTAELREVVGSERVRVPGDRPHATRGEHPHQHGFAAYMNQHRFQLIRATAIALTFGAIISLISGIWWLLPLAAGVHALGTMTVVMTIVRMTTVSEHVAPEVAAAMAEEGVSNPDEHFSRMVEEFRDTEEAGATEVMSPGFNERTADALDEPARASGEQSGAMTPTSQPSEPASGGAPDFIIWSTALALLALSIVLPATMGGGWLWLLPAVMVPLLAAWMVVQRLMITRAGEIHLQGRGPVLTIVLCTAVAVAGFCAIVALAFAH
jgi:uncharacterized membrane protein